MTQINQNRTSTVSTASTINAFDPLSAAAYRQFSARPDVQAGAEAEVFGGQPVEIAGVGGIVRWAARSLGRASDNLANGVSRGHMQRHFRRLASQPGKSIFRNPGKAPGYVNTALREARDIALRNADDIAAGRAVRSGATEVAQQGNRLAVTRNMGKAIGQDGEQYLRVVVGRTGQIVTAYPVRSVGAGAFFGAIGLPDGRAEQMYQRFDDQVARTTQDVRASSRNEGFNLFNEIIGLLDPTGIFYAEPANAGEAAWLATRDGASRALRDIESGLGRRLSETEQSIFRRRFVEAVQTGVGISADE